MLQMSWGKETERLKQNLLLQSQKLDAAQQRVAELETQLSKKEHLIAEQKKFLEDVKTQAKYDIFWYRLRLFITYKELIFTFMNSSPSVFNDLLCCLIPSFYNVSQLFLFAFAQRGTAGL